MTQGHKENNQINQNLQRVTRFYRILIVISVIIMIIAAYVTYGYQIKETRIAFGDNKPKKVKINKNINIKSNSMGIGADLSNIPSDGTIEDILNDVIPNVCDYPSSAKKVNEKCDKKPLKCLKSYEIDKIIVQDPSFENQLFIKLVTGKNKKETYTVVVDISKNNEVISQEGKIDKKRCRELEDEDNSDKDIKLDESFLEAGTDPTHSHYVDAEEPK